PNAPSMVLIKPETYIPLWGVAAKRPIFRDYVKSSAPLWVTNGVGDGGEDGVGGGQRGSDEGGVAAGVVTAVVVVARGGEWCGGSDRSGDGESFWVRRNHSPEKFSGGGRRWWRWWLAGWRLPAVVL
nr:hypothetical protein [Tanacetum cinerariifolium]